MRRAIARPISSAASCDIGSCGVPRPSLADYVRGPQATPEATAARSVLMLPTLRPPGRVAGWSLDPGSDNAEILGSA
jgi:hypothetical protein